MTGAARHPCRDSNGGVQPIMFYTYGDVRLHYEDIGTGDPMLLIHGMGCDMRIMTDCMEPVFRKHGAHAYRRLYLDLPGMGSSTAPLGFASSDRILEAIVAFADEVAGDRFALVGESYGGYLARGVLSRRPADVTGLMLVCPVVNAPHGMRDLPDDVTHFTDDDYLRSLDAKDRSRFMDSFVIADKRTHDRYVTALRDGMDAADPTFLHALSQSYAYSFDVDARIAQLGFDRPSLFVTGRQDDVVGYRDLMRLLPSYPRATFAVLDAAGHNAQIERSDPFDALAADWLDRLEHYAH